MAEYKNQSVEQFHEQLSKKFQSIDKSGMRVDNRDDKEIYKAGLTIISKTLEKIMKSGSKYEKWALEPLTQLYKDFDKAQKLYKRYKYCTNAENKKLLNDLANEIDNKENEVLQRLLLTNANYENKQAVEKSAKEHGKSFFIAQKNGSIVFTKESNPVKIHDALHGLFNKNQNYRIDYSKCANPKIKSKMEAFI